MLKHRFPKLDSLEFEEKSEDGATINAQFKAVKDEINKEKSGFREDGQSVDEPLWEKISSYNKSKFLFPTKGVDVGFRITNAGWKMLEILFAFNMFKNRGKNRKNPTLRHFDNTSAPGNFIMATHYYIMHYTVFTRHDWYASSFYGGDESIIGLSGLESKYPERLAMGPKNDGDVMKTENLLDWESKFPNMDLYTTDLGFPLRSEEQYNEQEKYHAHGNLGQILAGLLMLKLKGVLVAKMFTAHEPWTHSLFAVLSHVFEAFWLYKPIYSNPINTETYVVGCGYKGLTKDLRSHLLSAHKNFHFDTLLCKIPKSVEKVAYSAMTNLRDIVSLFLKSLLEIYKDLRDNPEKQKDRRNLKLNVDRSKEVQLFKKIFPPVFAKVKHRLLK